MKKNIFLWKIGHWEIGKEDQKNLIIDLQNQHRLAGDALPEWDKVSSLSSSEDVIPFNEKLPIKLTKPSLQKKDEDKIKNYPRRQ